MKFLNFMSGLLESYIINGKDYQTRKNYLDQAGFGWLDGLLSALEKIVGPILILVATVGVIYAIYLGVLLAKAENAEKREEAKKRIINVVIAIAITAVLIFLMYLFSSNVSWFVKLSETGDTTGGTAPTTPAQSGGVIGLLKMM